MKYLCFLIVLSCISCSFQRSTPEDDHYIGAVVEFMVNWDSANNLINYVRLIQEAAEQNADIVVFPELTLTNTTSLLWVPVNSTLLQYPIPADYPDIYDELMVGISAAARQYEIYVVINGRERMDCTVQDNGEYCPEERVYVFNTNVVFDRTGAVIDRYRKIVLFGEIGHTAAFRPELGMFETDFGVTFGHFICFDLKFQVPSIQIVQKNNISNIIFPAMWLSELPYLTAVQIQEAYAYSLDINFLAAGASNPRAGAAGSGIYSGKAGALISIMSGLPTTRLLVAKVPKVPGQVTEAPPGPIYNDLTDQDNMRMIIDSSLAAHLSAPLEQGLQEITLVHRDLTCTFRINLNQRNNDTYYRYRAGAFSGVRSYSGVATAGTRICSVYACTGDTRETCGTRFSTYIENATALFDELTIVGTMPTPVLDPVLDVADSVVYPVSMSVYLLPLETNEYSYSQIQNDNLTVHTMALNNQTAELYSFALWSREFSSDGQDADPPYVESDVTEAPITEATSAPCLPPTCSSIVHLLSTALLVSMLSVIHYIQF